MDEIMAKMAGDGRPKSMAQMRQWDLNRRHAADNMRASLKGGNPHDWDIFEQEGCVVDGKWTRAWCVYARNDRDRAYEHGLWFNDDKVAAAVLAWKRQRGGKKPWAVTRAIVRIWRGLPWR